MFIWIILWHYDWLPIADPYTLLLAVVVLEVWWLIGGGAASLANSKAVRSSWGASDKRVLMLRPAPLAKTQNFSGFSIPGTPEGSPAGMVWGSAFSTAGLFVKYWEPADFPFSDRPVLNYGKKMPFTSKTPWLRVQLPGGQDPFWSRIHVGPGAEPQSIPPRWARRFSLGMGMAFCRWASRFEVLPRGPCGVVVRLFWGFLHKSYLVDHQMKQTHFYNLYIYVFIITLWLAKKKDTIPRKKTEKTPKNIPRSKNIFNLIRKLPGFDLTSLGGNRTQVGYEGFYGLRPQLPGHVSVSWVKNRLRCWGNILLGCLGYTPS